MSDLTKNAPYYDDYDEQKQYTQILANPGAVEQAREFTQVQTMLLDFMKRISDTILKNGNIVSGMTFNISADKVVTVFEGKIYLDGKIHLFKEQSVTITGVGYEALGVRLDKSIVTETEDDSLLDPALNMENYGQAGAHRVKEVPVLELVTDLNTGLAIIYEFEDGLLKKVVTTPQLDTITDVLARRTYNESGNYRVNGLELSVEEYSASQLQVVVNVGTAYIRGYEVIKPYPSKKAVDLAKDTSSVVNEQKTYRRGTSKYQLTNYPCSEVTRVTGQVSKEVQKTKGSNGTIDTLPNTSIVKINSVWGNSATYYQGTDYVLNGNGIEWISDNHPNTGQTYYVNYSYNRELVDGVDYRLLKNEVNISGLTRDYIEILAENVVNSSPILIDYNFYLSRIDAVSMDKNGNIIVTKGQPATAINVKEPYVTSKDSLLLGYVKLAPNSAEAETVNDVITRTEMEQIQKMRERIDNLEYNLAMTQLDISALSSENPSELQAIFTDGFNSILRGDLTNEDFSAIYFLGDGMIGIQDKTSSVVTPQVRWTNTNAKLWDRLLVAPYSETLAISQPFATNIMKVNPYQVFETLASMKVIPDVDNWIEEDYLKIEKTETSRRFVSSGTRSGTILGTSSSQSTTQSIIEEAITYMRQNEIEVQGENFAPFADNITCTFDGKVCNLTPITNYGTTGGVTGTMRANSNGEVRGKITIPPNVQTGTREVCLYNSDTTCSAQYTSIGTKKTTIDTVITKVVTKVSCDPLAQSFSFPEETVVTSIGLYFCKDNTDTKSAIVQVRGTTNGYPNNVIYASKLLPISEIKFSEDSSLETKVTFDKPVICEAGEQYAIVVETDSLTHSMFYCNLNERDILTGEEIIHQPYSVGMMFSSSNSLAWTAHPNANLKFKVYKAQFEQNCTINFEPIRNIQADRLEMIADYVVPYGTSLTFEYSSDGVTYNPLTPSGLEILDNVINTVYLRAKMEATKNSTPMLVVNSMIIAGYLQDTTGTYISKNIETYDYYTNVRVTFEAWLPNGSNVVPKISTDKGLTWTNHDSLDTRYLDDGYVFFDGAFSVPAESQISDFKVRLDITCDDATIHPYVRRLISVLK